MLSSLRLRNFQCHQDLTVEFDPRVTIITGPSDAGKSAIIRALRWLCQNRPSGEAFKRHGSKFVRVRLVTDDHEIVRSKGTKGNLYALDGKWFKAFGSDIPNPIAKILNVGDHNFQGQFDPVFWLSNSAGEVSRNLNQIINLEVIDKSLAYIASQLRRATSEVEVTETRLQTARDDLQKLAWVPEMLTRLEGLERAEQQLAKKRSRIAGLESLLEDAENHEQSHSSAADAIVSGRNAARAGKEVLEWTDHVEALSQLIESCERHEEQIWQLKSAIEKLNAQLAKVKTCPACGSPMQPSSPSAAPTCTSPKRHPLPGQLSLIG